MVKRALWSLFLLVFPFVWGIPPLFAQDLPNNKFGIHITDINEAQKASELVNSSGGEWGYVAFIINSNDRKVDKWQERMNILNEKKLIPIVRIATYGSGDTWMKPVKDDAHDWAVFLSSLHWPTKQKLVVIYNEPNHGYEWGGATNPSEYAQVLSETIDKLKAADPDFVVMNAGFDASSPNEPPRYMDQERYMDEMEKAVPGIFTKLDAWSSHSYPNPGFSGRVTDTGRGSIRTYEWELDLLRRKYNVTKQLPVYITETGWVTKNADHPRLRYDESQTAAFTKEAFERVWLPDNRVRAVTPFMLSYKQPLFSHFSWLRSDDSETPTFSEIKGIGKTKGEVEQEYSSAITTVAVPSLIQKGREVVATVAVKNTGSAIWRDGESITLDVGDPDKIVTHNHFTSFDSRSILPGQTYIFRFTLFKDDLLRKASLSFQMKKGDQTFGEKLYVPIKIFQPPTLTVALVNPPEKVVENATVTFRKGSDADAVAGVRISSEMTVGKYTSYTFVPEERVVVELQAPNRDPVRKDVLITEGENIVSMELPPELPFWTQFVRLVQARVR